MKTIALALLVTVPSLGWAQVVNSPAFPQADAPVATSLLPRLTPQVVEVTRPALYQSWYFWTGVGAVVTGAVVAAVLLSMSSKPRTVSENTLCGGHCDACVGFSCP